MSPGSTGGVDVYYCNRGQRGAHPRPFRVSEKRLLPWIKAEAKLFRGPDAVILDGERYDDSADRRALEAMRGRIADSIIDAGLADLNAKREAHGERLQLVEELPESIDWEHDPPDAINGVLRTLWEYVELDADLRPVRAEWRVPQWRA